MFQQHTHSFLSKHDLHMGLTSTFSPDHGLGRGRGMEIPILEVPIIFQNVDLVFNASIVSIFFCVRVYLKSKSDENKLVLN